MQLDIYQRDVELTQEQIDYLKEKIATPFDKFLQHFDEDVKKGRITVHKYNDGAYSITLDMTLPRKYHFYVDSNGFEYVKVISELKSKIKNQIEHYKSKHLN